jgi:flagellar FliL protein
MADVATEGMQDERPARGRKPILIGIVLALLGAGAAFYATWSGLLGGTGAQSETVPQALPDVAFVPIDPVVVSLPGTTGTRQMRFTAQIEVESLHAEEVRLLMPRILDVLNGYLRAVEPTRFDEPGALLRIRAQLLRRIQIVTGEGRVRDLLVTEFMIQ